MTAHAAGLALMRIAEHPDAERIDPQMRLVLAAMGWSAGSRSDPRCRSGNPTLAERTGLARSTVALAVRRLADMGLIVAASGGSGKVTEWRLVLLADDADRTGSRSGTRSRDRTGSRSGTGPALIGTGPALGPESSEDQASGAADASPAPWLRRVARTVTERGRAVAMLIRDGELAADDPDAWAEIEPDLDPAERRGLLSVIWEMYG